MKIQVLHTVWCNISGEAAGEFWNWSLLGVRGLMYVLSSTVNWASLRRNAVNSDSVLLLWIPRWKLITLCANIAHSPRCERYTKWTGRDKTPVRLPGANQFLCGASRSPWQLARRASKVEPETLKMYTFSDFTLQYFKLIRRRLPFVIHSKGESAHRRKKSGQVRINSGQVDLSHSLPQGQAEKLFFVAPWVNTVRSLWGPLSIKLPSKATIPK